MIESIENSGVRHVFKRVENQNLIEIKTERAKRFFAELRQTFLNLGFEESTTLPQAYNNLPPGEVIIRRENPEKVSEIVRAGSTINVEDRFGDNHANAATWSKDSGIEGLNMAFSEGHGQKDGVVTVIGFEETPELIVKKVKQGKISKELQGRRTNIRNIQGFIPPNSIRFVMVRIPAQFAPEEILTEEESEDLEEYLESTSSRIRTDRKNRVEPKFVLRTYTPKAEKKMAAM